MDSWLNYYCIATQTLTIRRGKGQNIKKLLLPRSSACLVWMDKSEFWQWCFVYLYTSLWLSRTKTLTEAGITSILQQLRGADLQPFTPYDLRKTFITRLLEQGTDINIVRQLAGHSDIITTVLYDRRSDNIKRITSSRLCF
ncbi:TPA: tyrosine-type recombinase/integrase [Escherichia albertii]|nr:tyrosine-type recombinase/integrase [Escherichia albertii]HEB0995958.1 tyrosine-type recombinase/integrase [Escherichia albertii]HEB1000538.1 tyrosine-type recombinase/integrase [Escherichia albertii]HEB1005060.1 tyrosine-type recombinase/integrase [Escherichia albertii]HEB1058281.1 tyrosine-type recombinase/integrase [Escherichia albertii]